MRWPLDNVVISQGFSASHQANDLAAPTDTPIKAPETGSVDSINNDANAYFGGKYITIHGKSGHRYYMGHNNSNSVSLGQSVKEGQQIGKVGMTGFAVPSQGIPAPTGPHIHFQIWTPDGVLVDPSEVIKEEDTMVSAVIANTLTRFYLGRGATDKELKSWVGKVDADELARDLATSSMYKTRIKLAREGKLEAKNHLPNALRVAYKPPPQNFIPYNGKQLFIKQ